jgi:AAA15 family ATPase/GTPase
MRHKEGESMLIEFSVGNYRSFKEPVTLSMVAAKLRAKDKELENNLFPLTDSISLLKSAVIYGANASGKSNLVQAIDFMRRFVVGSSRDSQVAESINVDSFKLSSDTENEPSYFEVIFFLEGMRYRYGFEADTQKIHSEWLYRVPNKRETSLFIREGDEFKLSSVFKEGKGLTDKTRDNALFLWVVAQFNGPIARSILAWFRKLGVISGLSDEGYRGFTIERIQDGTLKDSIISFVKRMDVGISDIGLRPDEILSHYVYPDITTLHKKYGGDGVFVSETSFDLDVNESEGTKKLFYLAGPLLYTLQEGRRLVIDELDARFHPLITSFIIKLFHSEATNPNNAQLIFATHDTNFLSNKIFRRDQIWFTEKDRYGATDLYSLAEIKARNDALYEKDYIAGKYGAIPFIGGLQHLIGDADA